MIIDFIIEDLMLNSYLQKNFHTLMGCLTGWEKGVGSPISWKRLYTLFIDFL